MEGGRVDNEANDEAVRRPLFFGGNGRSFGKRRTVHGTCHRRISIAPHRGETIGHREERPLDLPSASASRSSRDDALVLQPAVLG